jgi:hypothetical protein
MDTAKTAARVTPSRLISEDKAGGKAGHVILVKNSHSTVSGARQPLYSRASGLGKLPHDGSSNGVWRLTHLRNGDIEAEWIEDADVNIS